MLTAIVGVVAAAALAMSLLAYQRAGKSVSYGEVAAHSIRAVRTGMTKDEVRAVMGNPGSLKTGPKGECWQYTRPYQLNVCFGAGGHLATIGYGLPAQYALHRP